MGNKNGYIYTSGCTFDAEPKVNVLSFLVALRLKNVLKQVLSASYVYRIS